MQPYTGHYASKEFMVSKLDAMGFTGTAATATKSIVAPVEECDNDTVAFASTLHQKKHEMDQNTHKNAQEGLTRFQTALYNGGTPAANPQVQSENPGDIWVQPRAHPFYSRDTVKVSDQEIINASEPWRIYTDVKAESIKNVNTRHR